MTAAVLGPDGEILGTVRRFNRIFLPVRALVELHGERVELERVRLGGRWRWVTRVDPDSATGRRLRGLLEAEGPAGPEAGEDLLPAGFNKAKGR